MKQDIKKNGERITNLGIHLAECDEDAPAREDFDNHEKNL